VTADHGAVIHLTDSLIGKSGLRGIRASNGAAAAFGTVDLTNLTVADNAGGGLLAYGVAARLLLSSSILANHSPSCGTARAPSLQPPQPRPEDTPIGGPAPRMPALPITASAGSSVS